MGMESFGGLESGTGHSIFLQAACQGKTLIEREGGLACNKCISEKISLRCICYIIMMKLLISLVFKMFFFFIISIYVHLSRTYPRVCAYTYINMYVRVASELLG